MVLGLLVAPVRTQADETAAIGVLDQSVITSTKPFRDAAETLQHEKDELDQAYAAAARGLRDPAAQARLAAQYSKKFQVRQNAVLSPLFARARAIIARTAMRRALGVVIDRRALSAGGTDITADVIAAFLSPAAAGDTGITLPPSQIGFVDQDRIDALPKMHAAKARLAQALDGLERRAAAQARTAANGSDREALATQLEQAEDAERRGTLDPLQAQVSAAASRIAAQRGLSFVVDKAAVLLGGVDVTGEVAGALQ